MASPKKELRSVMTCGNGSLIITIPYRFCRANDIRKGDLLIVKTYKDCLTIRVKEKKK